MSISLEDRVSSDVDVDDNLWIDWKRTIFNAKADEDDIHDPSMDFTIPKDNLFRDMIKEEVQENWLEIFKAKIKDIVGLYDLDCFER